MVLAGLVAACASGAPKPEAANQQELAALFAETYRRVEAAHIEPIDTAELALGGLRNLAEADVSLHDEFFVVLRDDAVLPGPRDYDEWGAVTSNAVISLVAHSERLRAMEPEQVYDLFAAGLVPQLMQPSEFFPGDSVFTVLQASSTRKFDMGYDLVSDGVQVARLDPKGELEEQGLKLGDVIINIEGTPTAGLPKARIFELLGSGLVFGSTTLTVRRAAAPEPITLELWETTGAKHHLQVRENGGIAEYSFVDVDYDSTRYLKSSLSRSMGRPFRGVTAGKEFQANSILLDLRNTPDHPDLPVFTDQGSAVHLAGFFLGREAVGSARSRYAAFEEEWQSSEYTRSVGYPLVIVVDSTTSGAAEIVAAALQDAGRALVVGASTAGDGKLHAVRGLPAGGVLVTPSARAYSPAGYPIDGRGVTPRICTSLPGATLESVLAALHRGEGTIPDGQLMRVMAPDDTAAIAEQRALCPPVPDSGDLAYELAVAILKDPALYTRLMKQNLGS